MKLGQRSLNASNGSSTIRLEMLMIVFHNSTAGAVHEEAYLQEHLSDHLQF